MICPKCAQDVEPTPIAFTMWGGAVGPKLLSHVECPRCQARFNGKTGQSNDQAIRIYIAVLTIIALLFMYLVFVGIR
jgi:hypothetical protein